MRNIGAVATLPVGTRTHLRTKVLQLIDLHSNDGFLHSNDGFCIQMMDFAFKRWMLHKGIVL